MNALPSRRVPDPMRRGRDTGPIELRDRGPTGRPLGTPDDCYDGSPWELQRGELVRQMSSNDIHGILMALLAALFCTHARLGVTVMTDVYCDLSDETSASIRAPDVVLVGDLAKGRDAIYTGTPILAVEIRGTQSKSYLEEKVKLYIEHGWPCTWIVHAERQEVEVLRPGLAAVTYRMGTSVPLLADLHRQELRALPVKAVFDQAEARRFDDGWVAARERARAVIQALELRGMALPSRVAERVLATSEMDVLMRWFALAVTAPSADAFVRGMG